MGSIPSMKSDMVRLSQIDGAMPRLNAIPAGCPYHPRCPSAFERCTKERPELMPGKSTMAACWLLQSEAKETVGAAMASA
jgi:peptide/nickel transport system ATP-binding protein